MSILRHKTFFGSVSTTYHMKFFYVGIRGAGCNFTSQNDIAEAKFYLTNQSLTREHVNGRAKKRIGLKNNKINKFLLKKRKKS